MPIILELLPNFTNYQFNQVRSEEEQKIETINETSSD